MAKKTKKTRQLASGKVASLLSDVERKTADKRAQLAVDRSICWLRLLAKLDEIQVEAAEYFGFGRRFSDSEIDAELARHPKRYRHGREDAEWGLQHHDRWELTCDLGTLSKRLPAVASERVDAAGRKAVDDLLRACHDREFKPERRFCELVADTMRVAEAVADIDAAGHASTPEIRKPSPLEAAILDVLLAADGSLSAEEIATKMQRKTSRSTTAKAVLAAIGKLRSDCGFPGLRAGDAGFKLKPDERALAAKLLGR